MAASTWLVPGSSVIIENQDGATWLVPGGPIGIEESAPAAPTVAPAPSLSSKLIAAGII